MEYIVIREDFLVDLVDKVNYKISFGWKPQGGVYSYTLGNGYKHCQAMIKEK